MGLLAGYGARRLVYGPSGSQQAGNASGESSAAAGNRPEAETKASTKHAFPPSHSTDTVETLAALGDTHLYARLALWLADASEPDIAAFWADCYSKKENWTPEISNLLFLHWTRLDPQHAIDSTQGIHSRPQAWWAWACHDPQAALAAAIVDGPGSVDCVAEGIGKFQPDWLLKHFDEMPSDARHAAISSLSENGGKNPLETLKFLQQQGSDIRADPLKSLAREDPWAAVEWARQHPGSNDPFSNCADALPTVLATLAAESPDELALIAQRTPSGSDRLEMEAALFANLVKTDPAAALEQAKATTIPRSAAERYATIGQSLVRTDPVQSLQLAKDLLVACPGALDLTASIRYPDGHSTNESLMIPGVYEFMSSLMETQPHQVMEMIVSLPAEMAKDQVASFSDQWVGQDLAGYADWVNQQADPEVRDTGVSRIVGELRESGHFQEAAEWASGGDLSVTDRLSGVLSQWQKQDPEGPAHWLKSSRVPPATKARIQLILDLPR
jgi:hypothetical protein